MRANNQTRPHGKTQLITIQRAIYARRAFPFFSSSSSPALELLWGERLFPKLSSVIRTMRSMSDTTIKRTRYLYFFYVLSLCWWKVWVCIMCRSAPGFHFFYGTSGIVDRDMDIRNAHLFRAVFILPLIWYLGFVFANSTIRIRCFLKFSCTGFEL